MTRSAAKAGATRSTARATAETARRLLFMIPRLKVPSGPSAEPSSAIGPAETRGTGQPFDDSVSSLAAKDLDKVVLKALPVNTAVLARLPRGSSSSAPATGRRSPGRGG